MSSHLRRRVELRVALPTEICLAFLARQRRLCALTDRALRSSGGGWGRLGRRGQRQGGTRVAAFAGRFVDVRIAAVDSAEIQGALTAEYSGGSGVAHGTGRGRRRRKRSSLMALHLLRRMQSLITGGAQGLAALHTQPTRGRIVAQRTQHCSSSQ